MVILYHVLFIFVCLNLHQYNIFIMLLYLLSIYLITVMLDTRVFWLLACEVYIHVCSPVVQHQSSVSPGVCSVCVR